MASIFWDSQGVIMIDYLEQGRTINGEYYAGELSTPGNGKKEARKTDSAPAHTSQVAMTAATECGFEIPHMFSHDMAPSDYYPKTEFPSLWYTVWK